ncbi:hypothetical protein [Peribacillus kribbensis]|uniref:hypothetical protein n=1 Tax=Peribacillus kribbensis TaxID=356658 RepID=UPI000427CEFD|nr:hypothetical protein [Peribacillus kribbensis]
MYHLKLRTKNRAKAPSSSRKEAVLKGILEFFREGQKSILVSEPAAGSLTNRPIRTLLEGLKVKFEAYSPAGLLFLGPGDTWATSMGRGVVAV